MYIDRDSITKFLLLVTSVIVLYSGVRYFARYTVLTRLAGLGTGAVLLLALMVSSVGYASRMQDTPINANFIYQAVVSLFDSHWDYEYKSQDFQW